VIETRQTGPAAPTAEAAVSHRPLPGTSSLLPGGLLHDWQQRNRDVSMPLAPVRLDSAGNLANVRAAVAAREGLKTEYNGPVFMDSDIYKTLEAIGWEQVRGLPEELARFAREAIALLAQAQEPDGYLDSYIQVTGEPRWEGLAYSHELYCAGHLIQAAIAHRRAGGGEELLGIARRFADLLVSTFLPATGAAGLVGHPIIETALVELYRETGNRDYLTLASEFVERRGHGLIRGPRRAHAYHHGRYLQDHLPVRQARTEEGHAVRALYLEAGVVDVAVETGDEELLASSVNRWKDMVATKTYLTGGNGSRHSTEGFGDRFELPPDRAYNETCAAIASFQWSWRLLLATGDARYADHMERVLYNGFAAAISADGERFFYVNPLQRRVDHYEQEDPGRRHPWYTVACCPPNVMRLLASIQHYLATTRDGALYIHHYTRAAITAEVDGGTLGVVVSTDYPWSGTVLLEIGQAPAGDAALAIRVPAWSDGPRATVNDRPAEGEPDGFGYLVFRRHWQPGDVLALRADIAPAVIRPARRVDAVSGMAAIQRGPLVYCFEQADQEAGSGVDDLVLLAGRQLREQDAELPGIGATVVVRTDAVHRDPVTFCGPPYAPVGAGQSDQESTEIAGRDSVTATAIPYFQWDNRDGRPMRVWLPCQ
jgi:DUF1680 family protein